MGRAGTGRVRASLMEKARRIGEILDRLYPDPPIPLAHRDPYSLLVAVVLSAQCTDARVNQVAPRLLDRAPTPAQLADMRVEEIERIIRPCGLAPAKARYLRELARILVERHGGRVPDSMEALEALPGVGHKSASVVLAQAFGKATFPVDTHIHRLAARWGLSDGSSVTATERDLKALFPPETWRRRHLQMIYFGREYCPARGHDAERCPICSWAATPRTLARGSRTRRPGSRR